jgi:hypothetical protein
LKSNSHQQPGNQFFQGRRHLDTDDSFYYISHL